MGRRRLAARRERPPGERRAGRPRTACCRDHPSLGAGHGMRKVGRGLRLDKVNRPAGWRRGAAAWDAPGVHHGEWRGRGARARRRGARRVRHLPGPPPRRCRRPGEEDRPRQVEGLGTRDGPLDAEHAPRPPAAVEGGQTLEVRRDPARWGTPPLVRYRRIERISSWYAVGVAGEEQPLHPPGAPESPGPSPAVLRGWARALRPAPARHRRRFPKEPPVLPRRSRDPPGRELDVHGGPHHAASRTVSESGAALLNRRREASAVARWLIPAPRAVRGAPDLPWPAFETSEAHPVCEEHPADHQGHEDGLRGQAPPGQDAIVAARPYGAPWSRRSRIRLAERGAVAPAPDLPSRCRVEDPRAHL